MTEANLDGRMAERLGSQPEQPWGTEAGTAHFWPPLKSLVFHTRRMVLLAMPLLLLCRSPIALRIIARLSGAGGGAMQH